MNTPVPTAKVTPRTPRTILIQGKIGTSIIACRNEMHAAAERLQWLANLRASQGSTVHTDQYDGGNLLEVTVGTEWFCTVRTVATPHGVAVTI